MAGTCLDMAGAALYDAQREEVRREERVVDVLHGIRMFADLFLNADKAEVVMRPGTMITISGMLSRWADDLRDALEIEEA